MKFLPILCLLSIFAGCSPREEIQCEVTYYDTTIAPKRQLAQYNFKLKKGQDAMLGEHGMVVQFNDEHKVKVRFFWNNEGIFTEVFSAQSDDWNSAVLRLEPGEAVTHKFREGILAEATARE